MRAATCLPRPGVGPANPVQRVTGHSCVACGAPLTRAGRARGPMPRECPACRAVRRPRRQLRAYLRSAGRIAKELRMRELLELIADAVLIVEEM
jgi:hypothetical protein